MEGGAGASEEDPLNNLGECMNFNTGWCSMDFNTGWGSTLLSGEPVFPCSSINYVAGDPCNGLNSAERMMLQSNCGENEDNSVFNRGDSIQQNEIADKEYSNICASSAESEKRREKGEGGKVDLQQNIISPQEYSRIPRPILETLTEKLVRALCLFKASCEGGFLAQIWMPVKYGDQYILTTCDQPYTHDRMLHGYRDISRAFAFSAELKSSLFPGLPGRVFISKVPEWTSNLMYYNKCEYLRVEHVANNQVRGSVALPVFEGDSAEALDMPCCAVLELVTTAEKTDFDAEIDNICGALQAVHLRSTPPPRLYNQFLSKDQRVALTEITDVLRVVCHAHGLPLALTWLPCNYIEGATDKMNKIRIRSNANSNEKYVLCIVKTACYVNDSKMYGFVNACADHFLEEGQGVVGKALQSNIPFFSSDVKEYDITEYPLVHHARKFGLNAAVATRLRSIYTGVDDYILELFLPPHIKGSAEQQLLLNNLSTTMQRISKGLRRVSDSESATTDNSINVDSIKGKVATDIQETSEKQMEKKGGTTEKNVSLSVLQQYFSGSLKDAAKSIGVCPTTLKRICRQHGIARWPSRKIHKVKRSLKKIKTVLDTVHGMEGGLKFDPASGNYVIPSGSIIQDFDTNKDPPLKKPRSAATDASGAPSDGHNISKSVTFDDGHDKQQHACSGMTESGSMATGSSSSSPIYAERQYSKMPSFVDMGSKITVKATYREDMVRFKFEPSAGCLWLYEEVSMRFRLPTGSFHLKYLDDEEEWVMMVNDSDLQECLELLELAGTRIVKFLVRDVPCVVGSSVSSNCSMAPGW